MMVSHFPSALRMEMEMGAWKQDDSPNPIIIGRLLYCALQVGCLAQKVVRIHWTMKYALFYCVVCSLQHTFTVGARHMQLVKWCNI